MSFSFLRFALIALHSLIFIINRCTDKILNQLEIHAKAELYFGGAENQNGERRSILQRTSVSRWFSVPLLSPLFAKKSCLFRAA